MVTPRPLSGTRTNSRGARACFTISSLQFDGRSPGAIRQNTSCTAGVSQDLQSDNHQAYLGKYILMAMEYLTEEELQDLFQVTCITPAEQRSCIDYYQQFVRQAVDRELP